MTISSTIRGGIGRILLQRPDSGNAYDAALIGDLTEAIASASADPAVRVLVLAGTGRNFCTGPDPAYLAAMAAHGAAEMDEDLQQSIRLLSALEASPKPTVLQVEGAAIGLATGLAACADVVVAAEDAEFGVPDVRLGTTPTAVVPFLVRAIGPRETRRWVLTGDRIRAADARLAGLVHEVAPRALLEPTVDRVVVSIAKGAPEAVVAAKRLVSIADQPIDLDRLDQVTRLGLELRAGEEAAEGLAAHVAGRRPAWS